MKVRLHCTNCWHKTTREVDPKSGERPDCPKCMAPMSRRVRIDCEHEGCLRFTIVEGDPTFNNYNFYSRKYKQTVDIRNVGFVCSDHEEEFDKKNENNTDYKQT